MVAEVSCGTTSVPVTGLLGSVRPPSLENAQHCEAQKMTRPEWQFDEMKCTGVDFTSPEEVLAYDAMHQRFRDYRQESATVIAALGLGPASTVIDMGCGTGAFVLHAARVCRTVYAVDVSQPMLDCCRRKAEAEGIRNIQFRHGGFLTYEHADLPTDAMVSVAVLHHLPDFWKLVALRRAAGMLKDGGRFCLFDIVFPSSGGGLDKRIDAWIKVIGERADARLAAEAVVHVRDEHSTYDWVMEGLLEKAGFRIDTTQYRDGFQATYICTVSPHTGDAAGA